MLETPVAILVGGLEIHKPLLLWINDGLMAVFFLLIGLEVKREVRAGELSEPAKVVLPICGAIGGMILPALIYFAFNRHDPLTIRGWAIPAATDIAFALGVLALLGRRVPLALKTLLATVAIIDDIGAILIIALFYTAELSAVSLGLAGCFVGALYVLNRFGVSARTPYMLLGAALWVCVLKSGVHATLAGIIVAFAIPTKSAHDSGCSPLRELEDALHPWVAYMVLPVFAFANAGISLGNITPADFLAPVPLGIASGLFFGKQLGVFGMIWLARVLRLGVLPDDVTWRQIYGIALLTGIGFTMSLFIGGLAFDAVAVMSAMDITYATQLRLGVLFGSLISGVLGYLVLCGPGSRSSDALSAD